MANDRRGRFETLMLPHLGAAFSFARWLSRSETDAEDIVQDAYLRAFRLFDGFRGERAKPWLLAIVRNCHRNMATKLRHGQVIPLEGIHLRGDGEPDPTIADTVAADAEDPESAAIRKDERMKLEAAIARLPTDYREVLILREVEDLSYREIAEIAGVPMGTVMSRLARAREALRTLWLADAANEIAS